MNLERAAVALVALFMLAGCGIAQKREEAFNAAMNRWIGQHTDSLFVTKGPPTNAVSLSDGGKVLEYSRSQVVTSGGGTYTVMVPIYNPASRTNTMVPQQRSTPVSSEVQDCKLLFRVSAESRIESWSAQGNSWF